MKPKHSYIARHSAERNSKKADASEATAKVPKNRGNAETTVKESKSRESDGKPRAKKLYVLRTVKLLCLLLALTLSAGLLQEYVLCHADHNRQRLKGFYLEDENSLDVVYMGASEAYSDIAPGYIYSQYGLTSYIFATQSNSILNYKAQLKNILSRQNPGLIVIELNGAVYYNDGETTKDANLHNYTDNVPLDGIKTEWIAENGGENTAEYLFPILKYHGVWQDIPNDMTYQNTVMKDQQRGYCYLKGMLNEAAIFKATQRSMNNVLRQCADGRQPLGALEEQTLRELLQFCKDEHLTNVVFVRFPHIVVRRTYDRFERSNTVGDIVNEYGFDYLNYEVNYDLTGLDETRDFYNLDHLNVYGQQKFSDHLIRDLQNRYALAPRQQTEKQRNQWNLCSAFYNAYYTYSDQLIQSGTGRELSEDTELIKTLSAYLPR